MTSIPLGRHRRALLQEDQPGHRGDGAFLDRDAEAYVRLALAIQRHDPRYLDFYVGPRKWQVEARRGRPLALPILLERASELLAFVRAARPSERRTFLEAQIAAMVGFVRILSGQGMTWNQEARILYDVEPREFPAGKFETIRSRLQSLLPGRRALSDRIDAFLAQFRVPARRLEAAIKACLGTLRERTAKMISMPERETLGIRLVRGKPWAAWHRYLGGFRSRVEISADLPAHPASLLVTLAHEAYPGHHTYDSVRDDRLALAARRPEFSLHVLFSPQSVLSEGIANTAPFIVMSPEDRLAFMEETFAPMLVRAPRDYRHYLAVWDALDLTDVGTEAARLLLEEGRGKGRVAAFMSQYGISRRNARKHIRFFRDFRTYMTCYSVGRALVEQSIGDDRSRRSRFFQLFARALTPSMLRPGGAADEG